MSGKKGEVVLSPRKSLMIDEIIARTEWEKFQCSKFDVLLSDDVMSRTGGSLMCMAHAAGWDQAE